MEPRDSLCSEAVHFVTSCLNLDPRVRLNASQMLSHPWLRMCAHRSVGGASTSTTQSVTPGESSRGSLHDRRAAAFKSKTFSRGISSDAGISQPAGLMAANQRPESSRLTPSFTLVPTPKPRQFQSTRDARGGASAPEGDESNHRPGSSTEGRSMPKPPKKSRSFTFGFGSVVKRLRNMLTHGGSNDKTVITA